MGKKDAEQTLDCFNPDCCSYRKIDDMKKPMGVRALNCPE